MTRIRRPILTTAVITLAAATLLTARPALAGPPLVCFPFDVGSARTLPMGPNGWHDIDRQYDVSRLIDDTIALLGPSTPVIVRMETLRRATLYAGTNATIAAALLAKLEARAAARQPDVALAVFDFGYLVETYRLPDRRRISVEGMLPERLADHNHVHAAGPVFRVGEVASADGHHSEHRQET